MRKLVLLPALLLTLASLPSQAAPTSLTPYGREDNALGSLRWLPRNANEKPVGSLFRLVVVYDQSLNDAGQSIPLKAKGPFGLKIFTTSQLDLKMKGHSARVGDVNTLTGQNLPAQVNETVAGVFGDVRDGACSKVGTAAFSQAYSTTRTFFHASATPYAPISAPGTCEIVNSSVAVTDATGAVIGYTTTVTNHVPGFWIDVEWPTRSLPLGLGTGRLMAELWYGAAYDNQGDPGPFPQGTDTTGASKSIGSPADYTAQYSFTATPGAIGDPCDGLPDVPQAPAPAGTWQEIKVQVPDNAKKVTFLLFPKGDWDLTVYDPNGTKRTSGAFGGFNEQVVAPASGSANFPELVPGEYRMLGCNYSGETTTIGAVVIET